MNKLYETTKELLELIAEKRPDIEVYKIDDKKVWYSHEDYAKNGPYLIDRIAMQHGMKIEAYAITTDTLLILIPQLFGNIENPNFAKDVSPDDMQVYLDKALLQKYLVDGLWIKDQVAVLHDIIDNINEYL